MAQPGEGRAVYQVARRLTCDGVCVTACEPKRPRARTAAGAPIRYSSAIFNSAVPPNLGILTGRPNGFWVLDIDGEEGEKSYRSLIDFHGEKVTFEVRTGKGRHLYFALPSPAGYIPSSIALLPGIDIRGERGHVVAPPSVHVTGKIYQVRQDRPIVRATPTLEELVRQAPEMASDLDYGLIYVGHAPT